jgi:EAL domain-containing protein (putative c-di-GMP-specific phosphodiesterase class I)
MGFLSSSAAKAKAALANAGGDASGEVRARRFNTEDVSKQLLRLLQPLQVESLSLHDPAGELLWLNEGAFGPDERGVVLDALDVFSLDTDREDLHLKLDDDRTALCACARDGNGEVRGIALVVIETSASDDLAARLSGPRLTAQMRRFAQLLAPPSPVTSAPETPAPITAAASPASSSASSPAPVSAPAEESAPARRKARTEPTEEFVIGDSARPSRSEAATPVTSPPSAAPPALTLAIDVPKPAQVPVERRAKPPNNERAERGATIHARRYARLRSGGAARHYEVKPAPEASFAADLTLTTRVAEHVRRSIERYTQTPSSFAVPLCVESVMKTGWLGRLQPILSRLAFPAGLIGFSLSPSIWRQQPEATTRFIEECEAVGCFIVLDDFSLADSGMGLLRSSAVKCLKIDAQIISAVVNDKFAHATLAAVAQAARVLGLYCVAKGVSSTSQAKWLAGAGIEFADGVSRGVATAATKTGEVPVLQVDE